MTLQAIQSLLWGALMNLKQSGQLTEREAASIALVRFTWTREQALQKLNKLSNQIPATNF
ncbi:hypothetical protein [Pontibacter sp. SGAir0037]|uniref:hypothetical protein n=1 Tax=Pontibacter sp. SGAir0037 TaxID=2571030 RepID=UPI0010CD5898|nr:hypothetical protein [Pontibacter sp. SGAir0037]QCR23762.1 hypothetical protein C1N53_16350 [Pontibacter sp. SGAir0037]